MIVCFQKVLEYNVQVGRKWCVERRTTCSFLVQHILLIYNLKEEKPEGRRCLKKKYKMSRKLRGRLLNNT